MVIAVDMPITEFLRRLAQELVQAGSATVRAALLWTTVGDIHIGMVMVALTRPTVWGSKAQVLAVTIIF